MERRWSARWWASPLCAWCLSGCALGDAPLEEVDPEAIPAQVTWDDHVAPLMDRYCAGCHSEELVSGAPEGLDYRRYAFARCTFEEIEEVTLQEGSMPPGGARRLTGEDKAVLRRWASQGFARGLDAQGRPRQEAVSCQGIGEEDGDDDDDDRD
jgi:hypothetical protein